MMQVQLAQWAHSLPEQTILSHPDSPEEREVAAECSEDAAAAEVMLAATAVSKSNLPAGWATTGGRIERPQPLA